MSRQVKLETVCESCLKKVRFDSRLLDKVVLCPGCKSSITLTEVVSHDESLANETAHSTSLSSSPADEMETSDGNTATTIPTSSTTSDNHRSVGSRYDLIDCLGKGGFGEVWKAIDRHMNRTVAIKLPRFLPNEHKKIERFLREGRAAAGLRHPNIVSVFDAAESDGQHYLAIEFVDGLPLSKFGSDRRLRHVDAAKMVAELARALDYAHSQKIIHRDIKPQNVVVNSEGRPQILDFGLGLMSRRSLFEAPAVGSGVVAFPRGGKAEEPPHGNRTRPGIPARQG